MSLFLASSSSCLSSRRKTPGSWRCCSLWADTGGGSRRERPRGAGESRTTPGTQIPAAGEGPRGPAGLGRKGKLKVRHLGGSCHGLLCRAREGSRWETSGPVQRVQEAPGPARPSLELPYWKVRLHCPQGAYWLRQHTEAVPCGERDKPAHRTAGQAV